MAEAKQKNGFLQFILFIVMSLIAFAAQMLIVTFGDDLLIKMGVDGKAEFTAWIFGQYTLATFIAFLVGNVVAKVVSYILNRKKTFGAVNNLVFSMVVYVIMCVVLIIVETLIGEPLGKALINGLPEKFWGILNTTKAAELENPDWSSTLAMIIYSTADFLIVFLMEKFVIMNDNLFKSNKVEVQEEAQEESEESQEDEDSSDINADAEEVSEEAQEEVQEEAPIVEEEEVEEVQEEVAAEEETQETVEEEVLEPEKEEAQQEEPKVEVKEEAPSKEEKVEEAPKKEEAKEPAKGKKKTKVAPVKIAAKEEKVEEKKNVKESASKVEEKEQEGTPAVKEEKKAPAKKAAPAKKPLGSIEFDLRVDGYHFSIYANNKQLMFESQGFASLDSAEGGLETFKKALETGVASVYQDKKKLWRFIINKRYVGECYKTRAQAEDAIESVKKFVELGKVIDYVEDPEKVAAYNQAKKNFNKGEKVDWDKALAVPKKTLGKFTITGHEERGFFFALYANNGQLLYGSRYYATKDSCEDAINTFKKAAYLNNFFVDSDKFGNYRFVLKGLGGSNVYIGESYKTKDAALNSAESVRKFAQSAKLIPYSPDDDD